MLFPTLQFDCIDINCWSRYATAVTDKLISFVYGWSRVHIEMHKYGDLNERVNIEEVGGKKVENECWALKM